MSLEWEPLTRDDAGPLADLLAAIEAEDRTGEVADLDDVREQLSHHLLDLAAGTLAAREGGRIVAFGYLSVRQSVVDTHVMRLTGGVHVSDASNASRTLLMDINGQGGWDSELCALLGVPMDLLPEITGCTTRVGATDPALFGGAIPICGMAGDQQAATIGQACMAPGQT